MVINSFAVYLDFVEPFFNSNFLLTRKYIDFIIWQEGLRIIQDKQHITTSGLSFITVLAELQYIHRKEVHPTILDQVFLPGRVERQNKN